MRGSEIGFKAMLKQLGVRLGIVDQVQSPSRLNVDQVQAIIDIEGAGWGNRTIVINSLGGTQTAQIIGGTPTPIGNILGINSNGYPDNLVNGISLDSRVIGLELALQLDAAGAVAMNGKPVDMEMRLVDKSNLNNYATILRLEQLFQIQTANLQYQWEIVGASTPPFQQNYLQQFYRFNNWDQLVPAECNLVMQVRLHDATNWAANTSYSLRMAVIQVPKGTALPF